MTANEGPTAFERASTPWLLRLNAVPRWLVGLVLIATLLAGLFLDGPVGAALLSILALFLGWLAAIGWRHLTLPARLLRAVTVVLLLVAAGSRLS